MARIRLILKVFVFYTLLVILWGAWVRISHSGDGCGDHWPLCQGELLPTASAPTKTWIELTHRFMSGLYGIFSFGIFLIVRKNFKPENPIRFWSLLSLLLTISEALLGAKLVLFKLVGTNDSPFRAFAMGLHLLNSLMLVMSFQMTSLLSNSQQWKKRVENPFRISQKIFSRVKTFSFILFFLLALTGAIAALSNTLFPSQDLISSLIAEFTEQSHYLLRLRSFHPVLGVLIAFSFSFLFYYLGENLKHPKQDFILARASQKLAWAFIIALTVGLITILSLSPLVMKLLHLTMTYILWILFVSWWQASRYESESLELDDFARGQ